MQKQTHFVEKQKIENKEGTNKKGGDVDVVRRKRKQEKLGCEKKKEKLEKVRWEAKRERQGE